MDKPHIFSASRLFWEDRHVALGTVHHVDADLGAQVTFRKMLEGEDWLAPLTRWWHSQETAPRDG